MQGVLIHYAAPWEMQDERTGEIRKGFSIQFVPSYFEEKRGVVGHKGTKTSVRDEEVYKEICKHVRPGVAVLCDLVLEAKPGPDGKMSAVVSGILNPKPVQIFAKAA